MNWGDQHYERVLELRRQRASFAVCTVVDAKGSSPRKRGAKMLVHPDGSIEGTIGGGAIEHQIAQEARNCIARDECQLVIHHLTHELGMCCGGGMSVFVEPQTYAPHLLLFGCGHVGRPTAELAARCGFDVTAVDSRPRFANHDHLPPRENLTVICEEPLDILHELPFHERDTFVVVLTHDHDLDENIVAAVLERPFFYLGCIGSERKGHKFRQRLLARGLPQDQVQRMQTPMGTDIGALTPDEIAVSIVGELIAQRRKVGSEKRDS